MHLNPYNQQRDASGCVTRFTLRREVADALHPVELKLASEGQLLHALAAGYVMECDALMPDGRELFHDAPGLDQKLSELKLRFHVRAPANRFVREQLQRTLDVLEDLISADWPRYRNLRADWKGMRARLASDPLLRSDAEALAEFSRWLFWDGQPTLTELWQKLVNQRQKILGLAGGRPILCSYEAVRWFLDIDAFRKLRSDETGQRDDLLAADAEAGHLAASESLPGAPGAGSGVVPASRPPHQVMGYLAGERAFCLGAGLPTPSASLASLWWTG